MPNTFPTQFSLGIILISAIALGSLIGLNNGVLAEVLSGWTDYTVLILVFLLFFELRPSSWSFSQGDARFLIIAWAANFIIIPHHRIHHRITFPFREIPLLYRSLHLFSGTLH